MVRRYELKQRALSQAETRKRIVEATVSLHASIGPARTTVSAIAAQAGVQRLTVYRHFPDERSLFEACGGRWMAEHPLPDPARWHDIADPEARLRVALSAIYAYFDSTEAMTGLLLRDLPDLPALQEVAAPLGQYWESLRDLLAGGWQPPGCPGERQRRRAVIGHALAFGTWRSLVRVEGLLEREAVELMTSLARLA